MSKNTFNFPIIVRVKNFQMAREDANLRGLLLHEWKYIGTAVQLKGYELKKGITYYIDRDILETDLMVSIR